MSGCGILLVGIGLLSLALGTPRLSLHELVVIFQGGGSTLSRIVVTQLRLPQACTGHSGRCYAGPLRCVTPGRPAKRAGWAGTAGGDGRCYRRGSTAITILHLPVVFGLIPWFALAGGLSCGSVVLLTMRQMRDPIRLVLTGVALTALLNAAVIIYEPGFTK